MNKSKFLILIIIGLLLFNCVLVFIVFKDRRREGGPKHIIIEKLHFDKEQIENYNKYIHQHRKAINNNETIMNKLRSNLYEQLKYSDHSTKIDSLIAKIAAQQIVAEQINYRHFIEIKKLCHPYQEKDFEKLTKEISDLFSAKGRK